MLKTKHFSTTIRTLRKEKNLTQKKLAQNVGLSESCIRLLESENCNPKLSTMRKLSLFFQKDISFFLGETPVETHPQGELFGDRLKRLRTARKLKQEDMIYGICSKDGNTLRYSELEKGHGNPTLKTLLRISELFKLTASELADGTLDPASHTQRL